MSLVTLALAKQACQINHTHQDDYIQLLLDGCEEFVQQKLSIYFSTDLTQDIVEDLSVAHVTGQKCLFPVHVPILSITSIVDRFDNDIQTEWYTVPSDQYRFDSFKISRLGDNYYGVRSGDVWSQGVNRWRVTLKGGYDATTLPANVKNLIIQLVVRMYEARGSKVGWADLATSDMMRSVEAMDFGTRGIG